MHLHRQREETDMFKGLPLSIAIITAGMLGLPAAMLAVF
jgi:hypothetical protein